MALFGIFGKPNIDKLKAKGNVRGLIKALGYTKNWLVREKAAEALGKIRDPRAVEPLSNALKDTCREYRGGGEEDAGVGTCGKDGQSVPVGVGMPTIKIDGITVGGTG